MSPFPGRTSEPELMDDPGCDDTKLLRTVKQFRAINRLFSNADALLERHVLDNGKAPFSILDVGAGGGDIMRRLVRKARRAETEIRVTCLDADPRIVAYAKSACRDYPEIEVRQGDLRNLVESERHDYVFAHHLLHHFPDHEIPGVLTVLAAAAKRCVIVSDLYRSRTAHALFGVFAALFCPASFARFDGMLSIRKGFLPRELERFAAAARLKNAAVTQTVPARLALVCTVR